MLRRVSEYARRTPRTRAAELLRASALAICAGCAAQLEPELPTSSDPPPEPEPRGECDRPRQDEPEVELPLWDLYVDVDDWDALHEDVFANVGVEASLCVDDELLPITLELQGASTRTLRKKSFDLKFNRGVPLLANPFEEEEGEVRDRVIVKAMYNDHSLIRESVAFDLWREMGKAAPRTAFTNLRINGAYWGLYEIVEPVDEDYLEHHGYPPHGRLYKGVRKHGSFADFAPHHDLRRAFESKTDSPYAYDDLEALAAVLQGTPLTEEAFRRDIDPIFPLEQYFDRMIWIAITQNGDAVAQNFFLYNTPREDLAFWNLIPWDSNLCFGADWKDAENVRAADSSLLLDSNNFFGRRLVQVDGIREAYVERFVETLDEILTVDTVLATIERHARRVEHDLALDQERWRRRIEPYEASQAILDFAAERPRHLRRGLSELLEGAVQDDEAEDQTADAGAE